MLVSAARIPLKCSLHVATVYVIMIAGANEISSGAVGLVYFCAVFPSLLVKLSAPYWYGCLYA